MGRGKKLRLRHRQDRTRGPSNGQPPESPGGLGLVLGHGDEEEDEVLLRQVPMVIQEQISVVPLRQRTVSKRDRKMAWGTVLAPKDPNIRKSSVSSRHSQSSGSIDRNHREPATAQRPNLSDQTLSSSSRSASQDIKLPILSSSTHSRSQPTKPCRKISHNSSQSAGAKNQPTRRKPKTDSTSKHGDQGQKLSSKPAKKPRAVPILAAITPDNVEHEKQKFFESSFDYNPQFSYRSPPSAGVLERYNKATDKLIQPAIQVFQATLLKFKTYKRFEATTGGKPISVSQFTAMFQQYLAQEGLTNKVALNLSDSLVARAVMSRTNGRATLNARPNALKSQWSDGLLRHEIGTHYIRSANNREHPWSTPKGRKQHGLSSLNPTEEGIASIHSVLLRKEPFLWRSAMLYYTTYMASRLSFADLFRDLGTYIEDPEVRWDYCLRAKRGQTDTSQPGCFNKDQVYLAGAFRVLRYRHSVDFHSLYKLGKVALEDVEHLKTLVDLNSPNLKIPTFMADIEDYRKRLDYVVLKNGLDEGELALLFPGEAPSGKTVKPATSQEECLDEQETGLVCSDDELVE
ncbi:uncharacterized protein KIAA0895-like [Patiria miniata]|uniref:KIAA0895 n=1 Tax=Patiria miniata TaxID=46514 RepID=A0A914B365_PATMI|nr:uncharacterized protein KIAA0895-like [Patiria miniata]